MDNFSIIFLIIGIIIVFFTLIFIIYFSTYSTNGNTKADVGSKCSQTADCKTGLFCNTNICVIPKLGSCVDDPSFCMIGTKCINGECLNLVEKCVKNDIYIPPTKTYTKIYITRNLNIEGVLLPINIEYVDLFFYNGVIFVLLKNGKTIMSYDADGTYIKTYTLNNIIINSNMEVYEGYIYTVINNKLFKSIIPKTIDVEFEFVEDHYHNKIISIKSDYTMTKLYKNINNDNIIPGPGLEQLYVDNKNTYIIQTFANGSKKTYNLEPSQKNPILYNTNIYFTEKVTKSYVKDTYSIFIFLE